MAEIILDSMYEVPINLIAEPKKLVELLRVKNPAYISAQRFSRFGSKMPEFLDFFYPNKAQNSVLLPRNFDLSNIIYNKYNIKNLKALGTEIDSTYNIEFRESQKNAYERVHEFLNEGKTDFLISLKTGRGKSILSLALAADLSRTTLVVCLTNSLIDQWLSLINNPHLGLGYRLFPNWKAGKYVEGKPNKYDITFATYSQLAGSIKKKFVDAYPKEFYSNFGTIIFDEWHRSGAETFNIINRRATCFYRLVLTATFRRPDKLEKMLKHHISEVIEDSVPSKSLDVFVYQSKIRFGQSYHTTYTAKAIPFSLIPLYSEVRILRRKSREITVDIVVIDKTIKDGIYTLHSTTGEKFYNADYIALLKETTPQSQVDSKIANNLSVINELTDIINSLYSAGRTVLVLTRRVDLIFRLYNRLIKTVPELGAYLSDKRPEYKKFCNTLGTDPKSHQYFCRTKARVILAIENLAKEGLDISTANTLVVVHPMKDIEQPVGRIDRGFDNGDPFVVYMDYSIPAYYGLLHGAKGAKYWFNKLGHRVIETKDKLWNI